ncbi:hypothetical protein BO94DRAFT_573791, partial [Aspergillus sclerotioniger CBS 115572]
MHTIRARIRLRQGIRPPISNETRFSRSRISYTIPREKQWFRRWNCLLHTLSAPSQPQALPLAISHGLSTVDCNEESLYRYTSGRWLWNENEQLSRRYVKFNLDELVRIAVRVTGSSSCIQVQKLPEGNFSKVFLITMDDNKEVIAKLPNPNAGRPHFTTASEVATMDYVRNVLNIPTPKVYKWSSSAATPVGAEYIIMERSRGVELSRLWDDMPGSEKFQIVKQLVGFEKSLVSSQFPMYGSLYYAKDLPDVRPSQVVGIGSKQDTVDSVFAIGPTTNRNFFDDGRDAVDVNRGPYLHGDNIFVNPDRPTEILSIIDWQAVNLSPLFLQARHPALVEFEGPIPEGPGSINLPDNFDELNPEEQLEAKKLRAAQSLYKLYDIQLIQQCPDIAHALRFKYSLAGQITGLAGSIFSDGEPIVQGMLMRLQEEWPSSTGLSIPCPLSFTAKEKETQREEAEKWATGVELMEKFLHQVGAYRGWDGWVNHDNYEHYKERFDRCREQFLNSTR